MKEQLKKKLAGVKKRYYVLAGLLLAALVTVVSVAIKASAFDGYRLEGGNNLVWKRDQKKASDTATLKYVTDEWWFFPQQITPSDSLTRSDWEAAKGFPLSTRVIGSTEVINEMYTDTVQVQEDDLVPNVMEWVKEGISSRAQLMTGIDVYASPVYQVRYKGSLQSTTYWNQNTILSAPSQWGSEWTGKAKDAIEESYNKHLKLYFEYVPFSIKFVDEEGNPVRGTLKPENIEAWGKDYTLAELQNIVFFGETIDVEPFTGTHEGYTYSHYYWSDTKKGGTSNDPSPKDIDYETVQKTTAPDSKDHLVLYFVFKRETIVTPTNTPTPTPVITSPPKKYTLTVVAKPEEGGNVTGGGTYYSGTSVSIGATANSGYVFSHWELVPFCFLNNGMYKASNGLIMPEADVTVTAYFVTPTPKPTLTPTPTPVVADKYRYENYYSTTEGYSIWDILTNKKLAGTQDAEGNGTLPQFAAAAGLNTKVNYLVGTDASGNEWYFIASTGAVPGITSSGKIATYVHPKKYKGYTVDSTSIKYINELTFPETITCSGTTYYVTSIGGAGASYYNATASGGSFGKIEGAYSHTSEATGTYISYRLGVIGNGEVLSRGVLGADSNRREYYNNHHAYNTTLTTITIPQYVNAILPYAFADCQALVNIYGGENVADIGKRAFSVSIVPELKFSEHRAGMYTVYNPDNKYIYYITDMYTYDESYAFSGGFSKFTQKMLAWKDYMQIGSRMDFPSLPSLVIIGESAFENRTHLSLVELKDKVTSIGANAFKNTTLDKIVVPSKSSKVLGDYETLGTKGYLHADPTIIETTVVDPAYAMNYGFTHHAYYKVAAGVDMKYYPNGGTPDVMKTERSGMEYKDISFTKKLVTSLSDHFSYVVWLGEDGYLYGGKVAGSYTNPASSYVLKASVQLSEYKFKDLSLYHSGTSNYLGTKKDYSLFKAVTTGGQTLLLGVESGKDTVINFGAFNEPSPTKEVVYLSYSSNSASSSFTLYMQGENLRIYKYVSSTKAWTSETALPCAAAVTAVKSNNSDVYTVGLIGTDGTLWRKNSFTGTWTQVQSGVSAGATLLYNDDAYFNFYLCESNGSVYDWYYSGGTLTRKKLDGGGGAVTFLTHKVNYELTLEVGKGADGALYGRESISGTASTGATYTNNSGWIKLPNGTGELLGVYNVNDGTIIYYSGSNGSIHATYFYTSGSAYYRDVNFFTTNITLAYGSEFAKIVVLGAEEEKSHYTETNTNGMDTYNFVNTGALRVAALDKAGYLWYGFCDEKEDDMFRVSDKVYTEMIHKEVSYETSSESERYDSNGDGVVNLDDLSFYLKKNTVSYVNYLYLRDSAGDVYSIWDVKAYYYREYPSPDDDTQDYLYETTYEAATSITPTLMSYAKDVTEFLAFPYIWFADGTVGNLVTANLKYDIFPGVTFMAVVSPNKWFTNTGKDFNGWNAKADGTGTAYKPGDVIEMGSYDSAWKNNLSSLGMSFYAQWKTATPKSKYIHYDANGGSGFMASTEVPSGNTSATLSKNLFTRAGHDFAGWKDEKGTAYSDMATVTGITGDKTMYARWTPYTYTLQFAYDDVRVRPVEVIAEKTLTFAEEVGIPGEPHEMSSTVSYNTNLTTQSTRNLFSWITAQPLSASYTKAEADFKGWALYRKDGSLYNYLGRYFEYTPGESRNVYGLTEVKNDVLTMFPDWNGGFVLLPNAKLPGYTLEGWMDAPTEASAAEIAYLESEADGEGGFYEPKLNEETLYALWTPNKYKVALVSDYEGSSVTSLGGTTGDTYVWMTFDAICPSVTAPTLPRYVFKGYYTEPNGQGTLYYGPADKTTGVSAAENNMVWTIYDGSVDTLYAYWIPDKAITYEPNYSPLETGCKAAWTEYIDTDGAYWTLAANEFTRLGYHFVSWNTKADGSGTTYADRAQVATANINGIVPLYAQWAPNTYTVTLDLNAPGAIPTAGISYGSFNIVFDTSGHSYGGSIHTDYLAGNIPARAGYTFDGWYTEAYGGEKVYDKNGIVTNEGTYFRNGTYVYPENATLYAHWTPLKYTMTLNGNKGSGSTDVTVPYSIIIMTFDSNDHYYNESSHGNYLAGDLAYRKGYELTGYYTADIGGRKIYTSAGSLAAQTIADNRAETASGYYFHNGKWKVAGNLTLYAQWKPLQYPVILDDRGAISTGHTGEVLMTFDQIGPDIIVPEKTGYIFQGYYTEIRGAGTKYYDEEGKCVKTWTETDAEVLYAYWTQKPVVLPEEEEHPDPTVVPEKEVEGSVGRMNSSALLYADDYNTATGALNDLQPYLTYDTPGSEGVIPGTEFLSFRARLGSWMLSYKFRRYSGIDMVRIKVSAAYRTQYERPDEELVISDLQFKEYDFLVPKAWYYWSVVETGMYYPDNVTIQNEALADGTVTIPVNRESEDAPQIPEYMVTYYGDKDAHIRWENYDTDGVPLLYLTLSEEEYIISDVVNTLPNVDKHLSVVCENAAWKDDRIAKVRNDGFTFDGETILSDEWMEESAAELDESKLSMDAEDVELTSYVQTYQSGIELDEKKANGRFDTTAVITYVGDRKNIGTDPTKEVPLTNINGLNIHTPVACEGVAVDGIKDGVLILKDALNFFTLRVDNTGTHLRSLGYGTKDFTFALSGKSNVAEQDGSYLNQVKFPFDVYVDMGMDSLHSDGTYNTAGDYCFEAGNWLTISNQDKRFYVPVTQKNGTYQIEFRTIAVNCPESDTDSLQETVMSCNTVNLDASCYIVTDSIQVIIRSCIKDFKITGTDDPTADRKLKEGMQALTLKKGYDFTFELLSQGEFYGANTEWVITPRFFWVSTDEKEREEVTLYVEEYIQGTVERECYTWEEEPLLKNHENHEVILQRFCGTGRISEDVLCVPVHMKERYGFSLEEYTKLQTITGREEFFKQNGALVINFEIKLKSEEGVWYIFDAWETTKLYEDSRKKGWNYMPGDIIRYNLAESVADDYEIGGLE